MNHFTVYREDKSFGSAQVFREGLYFRVSIRCPGSVRVFLQGDKSVLDLGICVPMEERFGIETRVPVKWVGEKVLTIRTEEAFYPVSADKPFLHLQQLRSSVFTVRDGLYGIQKDISNPTGQ